MRPRLLLVLVCLTTTAWAGCLSGTTAPALAPAIAEADEAPWNRSFSFNGSIGFLITFTGSNASIENYVETSMGDERTEVGSIRLLTAPDGGRASFASYRTAVGAHARADAREHHVEAPVDDTPGFFARMWFREPWPVWWNTTLLLVVASGGPNMPLQTDLWLNGTDLQIVAGPFAGDAWMVPRSAWSVEEHVVAKGYPDRRAGATVSRNAATQWSTANGTFLAYSGDPSGAPGAVAYHAFTLSNSNESWRAERMYSGDGLFTVQPEADIEDAFYLTSRERDWRLEIERRVANRAVEDVLLVADIALPEPWMGNKTRWF